MLQAAYLPCNRQISPLARENRRSSSRGLETAEFDKSATQTPTPFRSGTFLRAENAWFIGDVRDALICRTKGDIDEISFNSPSREAREENLFISVIIPLFSSLAKLLTHAVGICAFMRANVIRG